MKSNDNESEQSDPKPNILKGLRATTTALRLHELNRNELRVFMILLAHANYVTGETFVGLKTIAEQAGIRRERVVNALLSLEAKGFAKVVRRRLAGRGKSTIRRIAVDGNGPMGETFSSTDVDERKGPAGGQKRSRPEEEKVPPMGPEHTKNILKNTPKGVCFAPQSPGKGVSAFETRREAKKKRLHLEAAKERLPPSVETEVAEARHALEEIVEATGVLWNKERDDRADYLVRLGLAGLNLNRSERSALPTVARDWLDDVELIRDNSTSSIITVPDPVEMVVQNHNAEKMQEQEQAEEDTADDEEWIIERLTDYGITYKGKALLKDRGANWCKQVIEHLDKKAGGKPESVWGLARYFAKEPDKFDPNYGNGNGPMGGTFCEDEA